MYIMDQLLESGCSIKVYDPESIENIKAIYGDKLTYAENPYGAIENVDALCIVTEWSVFRTPDFKKMKSMMNSPVIFDGRNLFSLEQMQEEGFYYSSIGRKIVQN
ncbi:UDP-glucose/GDP-mannose dehydrogenase family protein [Saprospiraceae bacterium]|nr:UDP-glucose/GDP-mannose dehydrogenase family protein [Saprospiraceae bacterium]